MKTCTHKQDGLPARWFCVCLLATLGMPHNEALAQPRTTATPAVKDTSSELEELHARYARARREFQEAANKIKSDKDRQRLADEMLRQQQEFSEQFLQLAKNSEDPNARFEALSWIVANDFRGSKHSQEALDLLAEHYGDDQRLAPLCRQLAEGLPLPEVEKFLIAAAESSNHEVQGVALYSRALLLRRQVDVVRLLKLPANSAPRIAAESALGDRVTEQLAALDDTRLALQSERLLQQVIDGFADVPSFRGSLADVAKAELFEAQHLNVGQTAPDIVGKDLNGNELKLSDYRGKIVVLSFWAKWCPQCMEILPQEKSLAKHLADRPFALLGVNSDADISEARQLAEGEQMTWPSWWDGDRDSGPITAQWNVTVWPTFYVLDSQGVIRHKSEGLQRGGLAAGVAPAVDQLLAEVGSGGMQRRTMLFLIAGTICFLVVVLRAFSMRTPGATRL